MMNSLLQEATLESADCRTLTIARPKRASHNWRVGGFRQSESPFNVLTSSVHTLVL